MGIEEIRSRISVINAETSRINAQRNQNIGRQEALKKQLVDACALYKEKYGVELTAENVQAELASLTSKKEEELNKIEQILSLIKSGNIEEANRLAGVDAAHLQKEVTQSAMDETFERQKNSAPNFATPYEPVATQQAQQVATQPVKQEEVVVPPRVNQEQPVVSPVAPPVAPPVTPPPVAAPPLFNSQPTQVEPPKSKPVMTGAESLSMGMPALEGFSKPNLGSIAPPPTSSSEPVAAPTSNVKDFGAILSGTAFQPQ